jgi:protein SCO1/2
MDRRLTAPERRAGLAAGLLILLIINASSGCDRQEPPKSYVLRGQVLSVHPDRQELTIRHEDIPNFMPAMAMSFPVAKPALLQGREPGELVVATLEVAGGIARLTTVERTGLEALPSNTNAAAIPGNLRSVGDLLPDAAFIDESDQRRAISEWRGSATMITFIYTRCPLPNFCPLMDRHFAALQQAILGDPRLAGKVSLVSISFDPEFDTPAVLAAHARRLKADANVWTFLTGDRATVDRFAAQLGVGVTRPSGEPEITHNLRTVLAGADGRILKIYSGSEWTPAAAIGDLRAAVRLP